MTKNINKKDINNDLKIIALIGEGDTGKSLTLRKVIIQLLKNGAKILSPSKYFNMPVTNVVSDLLRTERTQTGLVSDITVLFEIDNKKILVTTYGDNWKGLKNKFQKQVNLYVCAAHSNDVDREKGNSLKTLTKNGWLITIGRSFYNLYCKNNKTKRKPSKEELPKQQILQEEQAKFIADEIFSQLSNV